MSEPLPTSTTSWKTAETICGLRLIIPAFSAIITRIRAGHITTITPTKKGSVTSNSIITIFEDSRQNIWFGTEGAGLCTFDYDTETFASFDPENQVLPNPVVYAIEEDKAGNLWIAGKCRIIIDQSSDPEMETIYASRRVAK